MAALLDGITARRVTTPRLTVNVLTTAAGSGEPVVFVHGNVSSSLFWQQAMLGLPAGYRPVAVDLRGFGDTDPLPVDATGGVADYREDLGALVDALELGRCHVVGWSLGGGVVLDYLRHHPDRVTGVTLVNPVSPYGFGGTRGEDGRLCDPSGAGTGGAAANPEFVRRLSDGDRSDDSQASPRQVLLGTYVRPPFVPEHLDMFVESMLSTRTGDDHYPGTSTTTDAWPGIAPGDRGVLNTIAPTRFRIDDLPGIDPKPPVHWIRGSDDMIVSDTSAFDLAYLGSLGVLPDWPGAEVAPPQPMVTQTRAALRRYQQAGGRFTETAIDQTGHSPHIEKPEEFRTALLTGLSTG